MRAPGRWGGEEGGGQGGVAEERMFESGLCRQERHPQNKGNGESRGLGPAGRRPAVAEDVGAEGREGGI